MSAIYRQQAQICQIYLKPTIRGITGWCGTPYVHADHFIGRREFPSHIHRPRTIPGRQIENPLWTSAEFMQNIPLKERLKRFVAMIDYMCVSATPLLAASVRGQSAPGAVTRLLVCLVERQRCQRRSGIRSEIRSEYVYIQLGENEVIHFQQKVRQRCDPFPARILSRCPAADPLNIQKCITVRRRP